MKNKKVQDCSKLDDYIKEKNTCQTFRLQAEITRRRILQLQNCLK